MGTFLRLHIPELSLSSGALTRLPHRSAARQAVSHQAIRKIPILVILERTYLDQPGELVSSRVPSAFSPTEPIPMGQVSCLLADWLKLTENDVSGSLSLSYMDCSPAHSGKHP